MSDFKKLYNLKIIAMIVVFSLLADSVCYSISPYGECSLRLPLLTERAGADHKNSVSRRTLVAALLFALFVRNAMEIPFLGIELLERSPYLHREIFLEEHREIFLEQHPRSRVEKMDYLKSNIQNYLAQFDRLKKEYDYEKILNITYWLNSISQNFSQDFSPISDRRLSIREIQRILTFIEDPAPISSNSISSRWLISISKTIVLGSMIPRIYSSYDYTDPEAKLIIKGLQNLLAYQEKLEDDDKLFLKYFPHINPQSILSERIQQQAKACLYKLRSAIYDPQWSKAFQVVDDLFWTFGTLEDMEEDIREIHYLETAGTIEIPMGQLKDIAALRNLDPIIKKYIVESSKRHNLPERLILAHLISVFERIYAPAKGIDIAKARGKISGTQAKLLKIIIKNVDSITGRNSYNESMDSEVMAFIGGIVLDAHSATGLGRLRPGWVKRDEGFDLLGEETKKMSTRRIAFKLWNPKYNIEAIASHWEHLAKEGRDAVLNTMLGKAFDTSPYSNETKARRFTQDDVERISFYKLYPSPKNFELNGEWWMAVGYHPVEEELQGTKWGRGPSSYRYGNLLPLQIFISRSGLFGYVRQKARITEIKTVDDIIQLGEFLATRDSFIHEACLEALLKWSCSKENRAMADKSKELLGIYYHSERRERNSLSADGDNVSLIDTELDDAGQKLIEKYLLMVKHDILGAGEDLLKNVAAIIKQSRNIDDNDSMKDLREDPNRAFAYAAFEYIIENGKEDDDYIKETVLDLLSDTGVGDRDKYHIIYLIGTSDGYRRYSLTHLWIRDILVDAGTLSGIDEDMRNEIHAYIKVGDEEFENQRNEEMLDIDRDVRNGVFMVNNGV